MRDRRFGWSLPPGVTHKMIDDAYGGDGACDCDDLRRNRRVELKEQGLDDDQVDEQIEKETEDEDERVVCESCLQRIEEERAENAAIERDIEERIYGDDD